MIVDFLPSEVSKHLRSGAITIVGDNALSHKCSVSQQVQPPVQLVPYGSSWMKISSCPEMVKQKMKMQVPGTRLTRQENRWKTAVNYKSSSEQDHRFNSGFSRKSYSDTDILLSHCSSPKMPLRRASINHATMEEENTKNASWETDQSAVDPSSLWKYLHPSMIPGGTGSMAKRSSNNSRLPHMTSFSQELQTNDTATSYCVHDNVSSRLNHMNGSTAAADHIVHKHSSCHTPHDKLDDKLPLSYSNSTKEEWVSKQRTDMAEAFAIDPQDASFKSWTAKTA